MIPGLLALLLWIPIEVTPAQQPCPAQPAPAAQVATQNSRHGPAVATILQSGSTNSRGYAVTIYGDGSARAVLNAAGNVPCSSPAQIQHFPAGTVDAGKLQTLLGQIGDVSTIPIGRCAKSVSFGTRTQISYRAKTSGDLQCVQAAGGTPEPLQRTSKELSQLVRKMLARLNVRDRRLGLEEK